VATIRRRLAAVSAFYGYLIACGGAGVETNPVPRGLPTRRRRCDGRGQPLVRAVRRLPRIWEPGEVAALMAALRTERDRAMVQAMVLGVCAAAKCSGCGSRISVWVSGGCSSSMARGGHQRLVPLSTSFFMTVAAYMNAERPAGAVTDRVFVVLKGPNRGRPTASTRSSAPPVSGLGWPMARVTSCATPVSPGCVSTACRWRRCRPRPVIVRSPRRRCICISARTGWPAGIGGPEAIEAQALVGMPQ
jgi:hypothetical protein